MQANIMNNREDCLKRLEELQLPYKLYEHQAVFNMEQMGNKVKLDKSPLIKTLFFADKKPNLFYMIIAHTKTRPQKAFWKHLNTSNNNVRMAKEDQVQAILKSKKGSVNPFCLANDLNHTIKNLIIDQQLYNYDFWAFHPMDNTSTVQMTRQNFFKFLQTYKINCLKIDLLQKADVKTEQEKIKIPKENEINLKGIQVKKQEDFSGWYQDVIVKACLIQYYDISGCYIIRPWAFSIWEKIQAFFDRLIKLDGCQNGSFPMFVSKKSLQIEKDHVQGFAPEVAWVTKAGKSDLAEHIAIRPTSQTIMYPAYAKWIKSHRDLPLKLNQWTNIIRWQFKHPTPFIRTRQFLWQEGHTAHATQEQAEKQMLTILQFYRRIYQELLAVPVIKGIKSQSQKFPGGLKTSSVETWIPENGRAIQAATSHNLGQNFAKMFDIQFEDEKKQKKMVWQTSWGITTRSLGIMTMYHGDNKGLVLPPKVANYQVVIVPIPFKGKEQFIVDESQKIYQLLKKTQIRVHFDNRDNYNPGWKFNDWELKGVPIRMEIGPKDIENKSVRCVFRHSGEKISIKWDTICEETEVLLQKIQKQMYQKASEKLNGRIKQANNWNEFMQHLNKNNVIYTAWCSQKECEQNVKDKSGIQSKQSVNQGKALLTGQAKTLCIPLNNKEIKEQQKCFNCQKSAKVWVYWGRSY